MASQDRLPSTEWLTVAYNEAEQEDNTAFIEGLDEAQLDALGQALSWYTSVLYATYPQDAAPSSEEVLNRYDVDLPQEQVEYALSPEGGSKFQAMLDQVSERVEQSIPPFVPGSPARTSAGTSPRRSRSASGTRSASPTGGRAERTLERASTAVRGDSPPRGRTAAGKAKKGRAKSPAPAVTNAKEIESLESGGIKEAALWYYKEPGSTFKADENKTIRQNQAAQRAAVTNDLVHIKNLFVVGKTSKIPLAITKNGLIIKNLHKAALRLQAALTMYGPDVRLEAKPKSSAAIIVHPKSDLEYIEQVLEQRRKIYDIYLRALRTRKPGPKRDTNEFRDGNTRVLLTEEAIDWVRTEKFVVSAKEAVPFQGKSYTDLWQYIQARTGSTKDKTFAYGGLITKGNYQNLLRIVLEKIPAPEAPVLTAAEKREAKKVKKTTPTVRRKAQYKYTAAMLANFKNKPASLNVISKEDTTKVKNTTQDSIVTILNKRLGKDVFSDTVLLSTGIMPLLISGYESKNEALVVNYKFFSDYDESNKDELDRFIVETDAIKAFYDSVSETRAVQADKEKKTKTKKVVGRRIVPARKVGATPGRRGRIASLSAAATEEA